MDYTYFIIPADFATAMQGKKVGVNQFSARQKADGQWVVSSNAIEEFPEDFQQLQDDGWEPAPVILAAEDFPAPVIPEWLL